MTNYIKKTDIIVIVDDNYTNLGVLSDFFDQTGHEVGVSKSGEIALQRIEYALPDLILWDIMASVMDEFETCIHLKNNSATCDSYVIFMIAVFDTESQVKGLNLGAVDYINKPFQQEEVLARVKLHLKLYKSIEKVVTQSQFLAAIVQERTSDLKQMIEEFKKIKAQLNSKQKNV